MNAMVLKEKIKFNEVTHCLDTSFAKLILIRSIEANYTVLKQNFGCRYSNIDDINLKNEVVHYYEDSKKFVKYTTRSNDLLKTIYPKLSIRHIIGEISAIPEDFETLKNINEFKIALDYCLTSFRGITKKEPVLS